MLYPEGIEVDETNNQAAIEATSRYLLQKNLVLFEPAIQVGDFLVRMDILVKSGEKFELIEVKAKSYDSKDSGIEGKTKKDPISSSMLPYIQDAAFQTWLLRQAFPQAEISTFLMMPDKARQAPVDGINQMFKIHRDKGRISVDTSLPANMNGKSIASSLLEKVCIDRYVTAVLTSPIEFPGGEDFLPNAAQRWAHAYRDDEKIKPTIGAHCGTCQYKAAKEHHQKSGLHECWTEATPLLPADIDSGTVLDLWNFRKKQKLIDEGVFKISQIRRDDFEEFSDDVDASGLTRIQRQWLQIAGIPENHDFKGFYFDTALFAAKMRSWKFPLHMIDFETSSVALPFYKGMRPYEPVAFQFSHHVIEADWSVRHAGDFLCTEPGKFPNFEFAQRLKEELGNDEGTVFMWSHHENTILSKIIEQLETSAVAPPDKDQLIPFLQDLVTGGRREMVDLCKLAEKAFFHPESKGSNSIKKVLPAVLKISPLLESIYSKPVYGAENGIVSRHFENQTWLDASSPGQGPYDKLKNLALKVLPEGADEESVIAEGGAAATGYARMQFEEMTTESRELINSALLRYCELDTLAMVMVVQAWKELCDSAYQQV